MNRFWKMSTWLLVPLLAVLALGQAFNTQESRVVDPGEISQAILQVQLNGVVRPLQVQKLSTYVTGAVNVLDFGAKGDGVLNADGTLVPGYTDDTAAFQAAIDTGKSVYAPGGVQTKSRVYVISRELIIDSLRWPGGAVSGVGTQTKLYSSGGQRYFGDGNGTTSIYQATAGANGFHYTDQGIWHQNVEGLTLMGSGPNNGSAAWGSVTSCTLTAASPAVLTVAGSVLPDDTLVMLYHDAANNSGISTITGGPATTYGGVNGAFWAYVKHTTGTSYNLYTAPQWKRTLLGTDTPVNTTGTNDTHITTHIITGVGLVAFESGYYNQWHFRDVNMTRWNVPQVLSVEDSRWENCIVNLNGGPLWFTAFGPCNNNEINGLTAIMQCNADAIGSASTLFPAISDASHTTTAVRIDNGQGWRIYGMDVGNEGLAKALEINTPNRLVQTSGIITGCNFEVTSTGNGLRCVDLSGCLYNTSSWLVAGNSLRADGFNANNCTITSGTPGVITLKGTAATGNRFPPNFQLANGTLVSLDADAGGITAGIYYTIQNGGDATGYVYKLATTAAGAIAGTANVNATGTVTGVQFGIRMQPTDVLVKRGTGAAVTLLQNSLQSTDAVPNGWPLVQEHLTSHDNLGNVQVIGGSGPWIGGGSLLGRGMVVLRNTYLDPDLGGAAGIEMQTGSDGAKLARVDAAANGDMGITGSGAVGVTAVWGIYLDPGPHARPVNEGGLVNYANNAAALTGGLVVGDHYRNGDTLCVVH